MSIATSIAAVAASLRAQGVRPSSEQQTPLPVGPQRPGVSSPAASAEMPSGLDVATRTKLEPILSRARERGLPVEALNAKAAEGILRGMPSAKIVAAVEALEERLTTAHMALAPAQPSDITAGADALAVGIKAKVLRTIRRYQPKSSVTVPIAVLVQLVSQGVPHDRATEIVYKLLERGATPQQLLALHKAVNADILAGQTASHALDARAATVLASLGRAPAAIGATPAGAIGAEPTLSSSGGKKR